MFEMSLTYNDADLVRKIVNQGIDSRLEGFTQSKFWWENPTGFVNRLECKIHSSEMQILIRRLLELEDDEADLLADDIVMIEYEVEII